MTLHVNLSRLSGTKIALSLLLSAAPCLHVSADTPLGWLHSDNPSAYTLDARKLDITLGALAVNDDIDFLDIRDDVLAGTRRLEGDSGDLSGNRAEIHVGITSTLSAFYSYQKQDLTIDLGEISSVELVDIDDGLETRSTAWGFKWNFYEAGYFDNARAWRAASLEVARVENTTANFTGLIKRVSLNSDFVITFTQPQEFRLENLEDDGWRARLLYSFPVGDTLTTNLWAGYTEAESTSGTNSDIPINLLKQAFEQSFATEESRILIGAGINWQITPRIPLQLSYEYIRIHDSETTINTNPLNVLLPSFLQATNLSTAESGDNHTLTGSLSYWVTPMIYVSLTGKVFSNQYLGIIPHFNNPLSGSFSDKPYGYAGLRLGIMLP